MSSDGEADTTSPVNEEIFPAWFRKKDHPDYNPGPIKIYNSEEIEEYMRAKHDSFE